MSPVSFKIRRQKYQVLLFFLELSNEITNACLAKATRFEEKFAQANDEEGAKGQENNKGPGEEESSQSESDFTDDNTPSILRQHSR